MKFEQFRSVKSNIDTHDPMFVGKKSDEFLTERERHLIGISVAATKGCLDCTGKRIQTALASGIPEESIRAAVDFTAALNSGFVLTMAVTGYQEYVKKEK